MIPYLYVFYVSFFIFSIDDPSTENITSLEGSKYTKVLEKKTSNDGADSGNEFETTAQKIKQPPPVGKANHN